MIIVSSGVANKLTNTHNAALRCLLFAITATKTYIPTYMPKTNMPIIKAIIIAISEVAQEPCKLESVSVK